MSSTETNLLPITSAYKNKDISSFPEYERNRLVCGIGHLGLGNFHRAHLAMVVDQLLRQEPGNWMIHGVGMQEKDHALINAMIAQDNLYSLTERSVSNDRLRVIGSIGKTSLAPYAPINVIEGFSANSTKIISLTVTEKGYSNTRAGELVVDAAIKHDLADNLPQSTLGYLFAIAQKRKKDSGEPYTIMSCDNLVGNGMGNGDLVKKVLLQFAELKDPTVRDWITSNVSFPNTMVDRITPVTTDETRNFVAENFGIEDKCPVVCEPFFQWVIEDDFINGRPEFEKEGVMFVDSVKPYEVLKTRMLNGSHSALAYMGYLMGYRKVDEAMNDPLIDEFLERYMDEDITQTIPDVPGIDIEQYKITLRKRFANPAISDQISRLAQDGSTKISTFIVPPLLDNLKNGGSIKWTAFALAAWERYVVGTDETGAKITVDDPKAAMLQERAKHPISLLEARDIFPEQCMDNRFLAEYEASSDSIYKHGTREALRQLLSHS
jgi:mannitol 2-dehydrogenase